MSASRPQPEVLPPQRTSAPPRAGAASRWLSDENLDLFTHLLDDWFRIPGTAVRFGLDGIIGLIPGLGDALAGILSCVIVLAAWFRGVPYVTLARMLVNLALDVIIGAIPFLGDAFDIAWKANRRNYALMMRHLHEPRRQTWRDWLFLLGLGVAFAAILLAPVIVLVWLLTLLAHRM
jgi:hypothetical protein